MVGGEIEPLAPKAQRLSRDVVIAEAEKCLSGLEQSGHGDVKLARILRSLIAFTAEGRQQEPPQEQLRALVATWRAKGAGVDVWHAVMGIGWKACADELEVALNLATDARQQDQEQGSPTWICPTCKDPKCGS